MLKWLTLSILLAAPTVAPEPVQVAIDTHPFWYAILGGVLGGMAVQYHAWVNGKRTPKQASAELTFSAIGGMVAAWIAAKRDWEPIDTYLAAVMLGVAGRPAVDAAQRMFLDSLLRQLGGQSNEATGKVSPASNEDRKRRGSDRPRGDVGGQPLDASNACPSARHDSRPGDDDNKPGVDDGEM